MAKSISRYLADISSTTGVLDGILSTAAQSNITSLGTLSSLTVSGSAAMTLTTAAQPNITSVGTLSTLAMGGSITRTGDLTLDVSGDIILDAAGSDVRFHNAGTLHGRITNDSSGIWFISDISDKDIIFRGNDGGSMTTALTLDMSEAGDATFNRNVYLVDDGKLRFGASNDLQIYHSGSYSFIRDVGTNGLYIDTNGPGIYLRGTTGNKWMLKAIKDGAVELYHNDVKKFYTNTSGVDIVGTAALTGGITIQDDQVAYFGTGLDLRISHVSSSGSNLIQSYTSGELVIEIENIGKGPAKSVIIKSTESSGKIDFLNNALIIGNINPNQKITQFFIFNMPTQE